MCPFPSVDPVVPVTGADLESEPIRDNFAATYNDLQFLKSLIDGFGNGTMALQNANNVTITGGLIDGVVIGSSVPAAGKFTDLTVTGTFAFPVNSIPYASIQQVSTQALLGNPIAGTHNVSEIGLGSTLAFTSTNLGVVDNTSTQKVIVAKAGSTVGTRDKINFIEGSGVTLTVTDNSDRVDVTVAAAASSGTVSSVSVVSANGLAGTVATATTTPAITLSTTIIGILSGNGTAISAASTTGSGNVVLATSPTLTTPNLGTPSALVGTNITGTASGLTAGNVTTNANLTGPITSSGNATSIASQTGTGTKFVVDTSPTLVTPNIGVATGTSLDVSGVLESGVNSATGGQLKMFGATSGDVILKVAAAAGTATVFQLPATNGSNGNSLVTNGSGVTSWSAAGSGTVTDVSVASANGFSGTVATSTSTPVITITTSVTGILSGNGTAVSAASTSGSGAIVLATGATLVTPALGTPTALVGTNITGTAAGLSIGGSAASLATGRTIAITGDLAYTSGAFDGTAGVTGTGTLATVNGNVGSFTNANITVNAKGLITAAANGSTGGAVGFDAITSGTNTTSAMVVGTGSSLAVSGSGTIAATTSAVASTVATANEATDTTCFPLFVTASGTANLPTKNNTSLTFNSNTANLGCTTFTGALVGNASTATALATARAIGGVNFDGTAAITPTTIATTDETSDTTCFVLFGTASGTVNTLPKTNTSLIFNSNTGAFGATSFSGAGTGLTGTAASLTAGTVTTNANLTGVITSSGNATSIASQTGTGTKFVVDNTPTLITPILGVASATSLATSAASPLLLTNGQLVTVALTSQTVGGTTLTIPDFASVADEFTFKTKSQTLSNKTFVAPVLGAATATSINKMAITAPATSSTLAVADGKTFTASNTITLTGTDTVSANVSNLKVRTIGFSASGTLATGQQGTFVVFPVAGTITGYKIVADAGTCTVKTWKIASGTAAPTIANLISTAGVSLATGTAIISSTVTDFTTTTVSANDIFAFDMTAVATATKVLFELEITVT